MIIETRKQGKPHQRLRKNYIHYLLSMTYYSMFCHHIFKNAGTIRYGLHASATYKKYQASIPVHLKRNLQTVRTLFQIINTMLGVEKVQCERCDSTSFDKIIVPPDHAWASKQIAGYHLRSPPYSLHNHY